MSNKEKILIIIIIFFAIWAAYFAGKATRKIEVIFSKPVYPVGNFTAPERGDRIDQKL